MRMKARFKILSISVLAILIVSLPLPTWAEETPVNSEQAPATEEAKAEMSSDTPESSAAPEQEVSAEETAKQEAPVDYEAQKAKAEADKATAEAEKAKAEAEKARAEAEIARIQADKLKAETVTENEETIEVTEEADVPGRHEHDGFFIRMLTGLGFGSYNGSGSTGIYSKGSLVEDPEDNGFALAAQLQIGGALNPDIILHSDLWITGNVTDAEIDQTFGSGGIGLGITHYWLPANIYVTAAIGPAIVSTGIRQYKSRLFNDTYGMVDDDEYDIDVATTYGFYLSMMIGREWWVGDNWGLGLAILGRYAYAGNDEDLTFNQGNALLLFSATFN